MSTRENRPYMQILVSTFGEDGIRRLAASDYPAVEGVEYLVSWQLPEGDCAVPESLSRRGDFRIFKTRSRGLSVNRNESLRLAEAPVCVIADDDLHYDASALRHLMEYHRDHPEETLVCFHCTIGGERTLTYKDEGFSLHKKPRGYYFTSVEISFKREAVMASGVRFEPLMGAGAPVLQSGEEEIFMLSLLRRGLRGVCLPLVVCDHPRSTTGDRIVSTASFSMVRGALLRFTHRQIWPLLLPLKALLSSRHTHRGYLDTCRLMVQGARYSRRMNMFQQSF